MSRPPFEMADIIRVAGYSFRQRYGASLTWPQRKVLDAIARCRTAALGFWPSLFTLSLLSVQR